MFRPLLLLLIGRLTVAPAIGQTEIPIAFTAPHIKSVRLHPAGAPLGGPYLELNGEAPLELRFDDLSEDWPDYAWTMVHCLPDWSGFSDLREWEYLEGWAPDVIDNTEAGFGGSVSFTHSMASIPSDGLGPSRSGNYLLIVHMDGDPEEVVLMRRMVVYERLAEVDVVTCRPFAADLVATHQRLEFNVTLPPGHRWSAPMQDIQVSVLRNTEWPSGSFGVRPSLVRGDMVRFDQDPGLTFAGTDRWRSADLKSLSYLAPGIEAIRESNSGDGPLWNLELSTDASRRFRLQTGRPDLNGVFTIHNDRFDNVDLTSDYLGVRFSLEHRDFGNVPEVYVYGAISGWALDPDFRMNYDGQSQLFTLDCLLKQGWYDYRYVVRSTNDDLAFEGNHGGTPNGYTVWVHAPAPDGADRVIGMEHIIWE